MAARIANVVTGTKITSPWGNSVADYLNGIVIAASLNPGNIANGAIRTVANFSIPATPVAKSVVFHATALIGSVGAVDIEAKLQGPGGMVGYFRFNAAKAASLPFRYKVTVPAAVTAYGLDFGNLSGVAVDTYADPTNFTAWAEVFA